MGLLAAFTRIVNAAATRQNLTTDQRIARIAEIPPQQAKIGLAGDPGCQRMPKLKIVTVNSNFGDLWQFGHYWQLLDS